jgi:Stage II sporulation protein E (SpoIIE)
MPPGVMMDFRVEQPGDRVATVLHLGKTRPAAQLPPRDTIGQPAAGDRALFHTDGVSEARNESGDFYPLSDAAGLLRTGDLPNALDRLGADIFRYRRQRTARRAGYFMSMTSTATICCATTRSPRPLARGGGYPGGPLKRGKPVSRWH